MSIRRTRRLRVLGCGLMLASLAAYSYARLAEAEPHGSALALERTLRSALRFEPNRGQLEDRVRFLARGKGYGLYLGRDGATIRLLHRNAEAVDQAVISMHVVGARSVEPVGEGQLAGTSNYFVGSDRGKWRAGIENYGSVRYEDVRPGVSVLYYASAQGELEYDLLLDPGVDPQSVELAFEGLESIRIDPKGSAVLRLPDGSELQKRAPVAYQIDANGARIGVASRYELRAGKLGFVVGAHDPSRALRIDPVLVYSTYLGGSSFDQASGAATDPAGNTYLVGYTSSTLFPTTDSVQPTLAGGVYDALVCKLSATGAIVYATFLGGTGADLGYAIAADSAGNAYVTGVTFSTNFPTLAPLQPSTGGKQDAFVTKINPAGSALVYSTYLGGSQDDYAQAIAVGNTGNALVAGTTFSSNFPKLAALQGTLNGTSDAFVSNLAPNGNALVYSTYLGGGQAESAHGVALDSAGNAVVVGTTGSGDYPRVSAFQATFGGGTYDGFVSKLNPAGSALLNSTYLGGASNDEAQAVVVQASGQATVVGYTASSNFPALGAPQPNLASPGHSDAFVSRFNATGSSLAYSTYLGGSGEDSASGVGVDANNSAYVVGSTDSTDFPQARSIPGQGSYHGAVDGFVTAVDPSGSPFYYSSYLGGSAEDHAVAVAVQSTGFTHVVGNTYSTDFPAFNAPIAHLVGSQDPFVARLPGIPAGVPASDRWSTYLLASFLLGLGTLAASLGRSRRAPPVSV
ncbi:MAG: SBBP repeat-containing protein [Polyangiaceae bacterium]